MSDAAETPNVRVLPVRRAASRTIRYWPWLAALVVSVGLPWLFYDWQHARHAGFVVSMLSQTGMMIIFALSFNMLMGRRVCCRSAIPCCSALPAIRRCISWTPPAPGSYRCRWS